MSHDGLPPPAPACLCQPYASNPKQRGGTLIAEDVTELAVHEERRCDPDGYRPASCAACGHDRLHVHDYLERKLRGEKVVVIVRYLCAACRATWRILPAFMARLLWRSWAVVEGATLGPQRRRDAAVPKRTVRRWCARLAAAALLLLGVLRQGDDAVAALATAVGEAATRRQLVDAYAAALEIPVTERLAPLGALIHRLSPGVRVM